MTKGEITRTALAIVSVVGGENWDAYSDITRSLDAKEMQYIAVALAGLAYGLSERVARHEPATVEEA